MSAESGLARVLQRFPRTVVWVGGDVMLDEYVEGVVARVSPEAPVPVVAVTRTRHRPGGAANVACNLRALGAGVRLCGVVGEDPAGEALLAACREAGMDVTAVARGGPWVTPRKLRVLAHHQQLLRLDWEQPRAVEPAVAAELMARWEGVLPLPGALVLSDYAKGFLEPATVQGWIARGRALGVPVLVGPKRRDFGVYRGATVVAPNLRELESAVGRGLELGEVEAAARGVMALAGVGAMVVTLGEHGMMAIPGEGAAVRVPALRREVYDVTGAGDTALAVLALALAAGADLADAARVANTAAGLVVGKLGTSVVRMDELVAALDLGPGEKVLASPEALTERLAWWRLQGRRVVFTNGCFDLLHVGHLALLERARALGDVLLVGLNGDGSVTRLKGPGRPTVPWAERAALLAALGCVDGVVGFDQDTPWSLIAEVCPAVLVKGGDYRVEDVVGRELVEAAGGRVEIVPRVADRSTTATLERLRRGGDAG